MIFYRLSSLSRRSSSQAFSGEGTLHGGGRWNSIGTRLVYTSSSVSLACLESLVHIRMLAKSEERWLFTIDVPNEYIEELKTPPAGWNDEPATATSRAIGDRWIAEARSVALLVPSVVVPVEQNALINPRHPKFRIAWVQRRERFRYDPRLG